MENLEKIEKAIEAIESGAQEYKIGSRQVKRADLKTLYEERRRLKSSASEYCKVAIFDKR